MNHPTDFLLLQCALDDASVLTDVASQFCTRGPVPMQLHRAAWSAQHRTAYVYGRLLSRAMLDTHVLPTLAALWRQVCPGAHDIRISRLELVFDSPGHSQGQPAAFHYVVEMDPDDGWMPEIERWYDTEHMPGLAAVPGCIHARRMLNHDHGPLSLACYELTSAQVLGSPPWLAVRGTAWSDITRPHFTNTRRTMFEVLA